MTNQNTSNQNEIISFFRMKSFFIIKLIICLSQKCRADLFPQSRAC